MIQPVRKAKKSSAIASQGALDAALERDHVFPVEVDVRGPIPKRQSYQPVQSIEQAGFSFKPKHLLHAIGCKTAALPSSDKDECLKSAYFYVHVLDLHATPLCFLPGIDSDLQQNRSMEIGIGMMCLFASGHWKISWDALESIPGRGKRFDYRGKRPGLKAIFEAKGTKYRHHQNSQVADGLAKKNAHHTRGERFDVELIVSTHVGMSLGRPRILIADPIENVKEFAFADQYDDLYRYRHYARVMQFIGAPRLARRFYLRSTAMLGLNPFPPDTSLADIPQMEYVKMRGQRFVGNWYEKWVPRHSERYGHLANTQDVFTQFFGRFRVFQGMREESLKSLVAGEMNGGGRKDKDADPHDVETDQGMRLSVFPDGSALGFEFKEE